VHGLFVVALFHELVSFFFQFVSFRVVLLLPLLPFLHVSLQCHEVGIVLRQNWLLLSLFLWIWDKIVPFWVVIAGFLPQTLLRFFPHVPSMFPFLPVLFLVLVIADHHFELLLSLLEGHGALFALETVWSLKLILPSTEVTKVFEILRDTFALMSLFSFVFNLFLFSDPGIWSSFPVLLSECFKMIELFGTDFVLGKGFDFLIDEVCFD
jgi:hypothetical protein